MEWLRERLALQERCAKTDDPAVLAADIRKREDTVARFCDPIMSRAPPPPPKVRALARLLGECCLIAVVVHYLLSPGRCMLAAFTHALPTAVFLSQGMHSGRSCYCRPSTPL